jgi:hypothetical protein
MVKVLSTFAAAQASNKNNQTIFTGSLVSAFKYKNVMFTVSGLYFYFSATSSHLLWLLLNTN